MKNYRPYCAGFIVIYVLSFLCVGDAVYTLIQTINGTQNEFMASFSLFTYLIAVLAILYCKLYGTTKVSIGEEKMRIVYPVYIRPGADAKRAMFIYRQGDMDLHKIDKTFSLKQLSKYGYIEDLGYKRLDVSNTGKKNKLFPVQEVAFVMEDGKRYHWNIAFYSAKQQHEILQDIRRVSGLEPEGELAKV